jgi:hypothetical protein
MRTDSDSPSANWIYLFAIAIFATVGLGFVGWALTRQIWQESARGMPIGGGRSWHAVLLLDVGLLVILAALYWKMYRDAKTQFGREELRQPTIFGSSAFAGQR